MSKMSLAVYPTQRDTPSFNSAWNASPGEPEPEPHSFVTLHSLPSDRSRDTGAVQTSTWLRSLHLSCTYWGSNPGAGYTHNPPCSCQNSSCRSLRHCRQCDYGACRPARRAVSSIAFGTESCYDTSPFLEKVLRFANRFSLNLPDAGVPII